MKIDHLSYRRAANVAILGLVLQLIIGIVLLIYSRLADDHAAMTAALYVLSGSVVWVTLAIVFDQHRRERLEAMELETLEASRARQASVFENTDDDMRVAAARLAWMHKFLVPGASLLLAVILLGLGFWRFGGGRELLSPDTFAPTLHRGWAVSIGVGMAVVGFVFARFVSGMAKQEVWSHLRGGAAQAVGAALFGLLLVVGHFADIAATDAVLRYLQAILPAVMMLLGVEIVLNFLLNIYRPRKPGEVPRPAFDSRLLGFIAAPDKIAESISDAINYQFGFDVTSSWFYQLVSRRLGLLIVVGAAILWSMTLIAVVEPDERGLRVRAGHLISEVGPGFHLKLPWPFERIDRIKATEVRQLDLANPHPDDAHRAILWTNPHHDEEDFLLVRASAVDQTDDDRELALVVAEIPLHYVVEDYTKYELLGPPEMRGRLLRAIGQREVLELSATLELEDVISGGRLDASAELRRRISKRFDELDAGVRVLFVGIEGVHPPKDVAHDFEMVINAEQKSRGSIESARSDQIQTLTEAVGSVESARRLVVMLDELQELRRRAEDPAEITAAELRIQELMLRSGGRAASALYDARAQRWHRHMTARGAAERYTGQLVAFQVSPDLYRAQLYFEALREAMRESRLYIITEDNRVSVEIWTDLKDIDTGGEWMIPSEDEHLQ